MLAINKLYKSLKCDKMKKSSKEVAEKSCPSKLETK